MKLCHTFAAQISLPPFVPLRPQSHGYCRIHDTCPLSHNILHVLDTEEAQEQQTIEAKRRRRRKRKQHYQEGTSTSSQLESLFEEELAAAKRRLGDKQEEEGGMETLSGTKMAEDDRGVLQGPVQQHEDRGAPPSGHRAGGDAYMTGYCFCCYALRLAREKLVSAEERRPLLEEVKNKISLGGKDYSLLLTRSSFTSTSPHYRAMTERMKTMTMFETSHH